jgi:hypothetical protein
MQSRIIKFHRYSNNSTWRCHVQGGAYPPWRCEVQGLHIQALEMLSTGGDMSPPGDAKHRAGNRLPWRCQAQLRRSAQLEIVTQVWVYPELDLVTRDAVYRDLEIRLQVGRSTHLEIEIRGGRSTDLGIVTQVL